MKKSILLVIVFCIGFFFFSYSQKDKKPEERIRLYWFVMLLKGSNRTQDSVTAAKIQEQHLANITRLYNEGKIKVAARLEMMATGEAFSFLIAQQKKKQKNY